MSSHRMKKLRKKVTRLIMAANVLAVLVMLLSGYSYLVSPAEFPLAVVMGLGFPATVAVNVGFLFFWMFFGRKKLAISVIGLLLCYTPIHTYVPLNLCQEPSPGALKVMSFNVQSFRGAYDDGTSFDMESIIDYIVDQQVDIACLQESCLSTVHNGNLEKIEKAFPYYVENNRNPNGGRVALLSKYPILSNDSIAYDSAGNLSVVYRVKVGNKTITIINNHLESTHIPIDDREGFSRMVRGDMGKEYMAVESRSIVKTLAGSASIRAAQADAVAEYIANNVSGPLIVCGDFNDSPISYPYHRLSEGLIDCFVEAGSGLGWSYCHNGMRVRIDHILCSSHFVPRWCYVDNKNTLSDHYSVICWLEES